MSKNPKQKKKEINVGTPIEFLRSDNYKMREVGSELAIAAARVIKDYDGLHRLSLAVKDWFEIIANEGGRGSK